MNSCIRLMCLLPSWRQVKLNLQVRFREQSLLPLVEGKSGFTSREYLTCRYGNSVWYKDAKNWYFSSVDLNSGTRLFDLEADPTCQNNITGQGADRIALAHERLLADAGGQLHHYKRKGRTDALGRPQFAEE